MHAACLRLNDKVRLPESYGLNEERVVHGPHVSRIESRVGGENPGVWALVEWAMETPRGSNPLADYSPRRYSEWFDLFDLEPA